LSYFARAAGMMARKALRVWDRADGLLENETKNTHYGQETDNEDYADNPEDDFH
jgi:hypothetical protein